MPDQEHTEQYQRHGQALSDPPGSELPLDHPAIVKWRRDTKSAARAHNKANDELVKIVQEKPRRPWHTKRMARACEKWDATLQAIPMPPTLDSPNK